jgi:hypothetical protein
VYRSVLFLAGAHHRSIELIGEEIYDEFDPHYQGAQLSSFIPPDSDAGVTITTDSANDPGHNNLGNLVPAVVHDTHTSTGFVHGLGHGPMIVKPMALRAKQGFDALMSRSKSAPPIPRDQVGKQPPPKAGVLPKMGVNDSEFNSLPTDDINEKISTPHSGLHTPHSVGPMPTLDSEPQPPRSQPQTPLLDHTVPHPLVLSQHLAVAVPPRIASPNSFEAFLLERRRRGGPGGGATPRIVTPVPVPKGKGFKSSPLSVVEKEVTDGVGIKGTSSMAREGDGGAPPS